MSVCVSVCQSVSVCVSVDQWVSVGVFGNVNGCQWVYMGIVCFLLFPLIHTLALLVRFILCDFKLYIYIYITDNI